MKRTTALLFILGFLSVKGFSQTPIYLGVPFFGSPHPDNLMLDTKVPADDQYWFIDTLMPDNLWHLGPHNKGTFLTGRALVTDSINPYPDSNMSAVEFEVRIPDGPYHFLTITVEHDIHTVAGKDGGTIEISRNSGATWENIISSSGVVNVMGYGINDTVEALNAPGVSGNNIGNFGNIYFDIYQSGFPQSDSIFRIRLLFASSDSTSPIFDGWKIKQVYFSLIWSDLVICKCLQDEFKVYPNPSSGNVNLLWTCDEGHGGELSISDIQGRIIYKGNLKIDEPLQLNRLESGVYLATFETEGQVYHQKLVVQ